ncbi:hypothetical protein [Mycolicibacterium fortuitum]|uniref:hypothetical protein n=1 Tax=Mycolicibacterium fortuitum TaxID=1766 RepID=UPI002627D2A3|nr:hypothetical protein [Mycolicibacterium fortuitum]
MTNDELDVLVAEWHNTEPEDGYSTPLHEFLGMTWDEYAEWTKTGIVPGRLA